MGTRRPLHRLFVATLAALAGASVLALAATPARAQVSSLQGEVLLGEGPVVAQCDLLGTSTIRFRAEGSAFGPYSGTYVEEGTFTFSPGVPVPPFIFFPIASFDSTFTIQALTGEVVMGTKTLAFGLPGAQQCDDVVLGQVNTNAVVTYEATIQTATGTFRDRGEALAVVSAAGCDPDCVGGHLEHFRLSEGLLPVFTMGKATGGGQLDDATQEEHVTFGFEVKSTEDPNRLQGRCLVLDPASDTQVKCLDARNYVEVVNTATWEGTAEVNGVREDYRITVQDNGEPNQGLDTFAIATASYNAAGRLEHGNVQLHKR